MWSENPTEDQLLDIFHTQYTFKIMRLLMESPMTVGEISVKINATNYARIYASINFLKKKGLIKIKEYKTSSRLFNKVAVFTPTIKNIIIRIEKETTITTDTKLMLHSEVLG